MDKDFSSGAEHLVFSSDESSCIMFLGMAMVRQFSEVSVFLIDVSSNKDLAFFFGSAMLT